VLSEDEVAHYVAAVDRVYEEHELRRESRLRGLAGTPRRSRPPRKSPARSDGATKRGG
jgi:hypothetical protein